MPPEYVDIGFISNKYDVFSLGVIIIKMMAGNMGYSRCFKMSPKEFIELVRKNSLSTMSTTIFLCLLVFSAVLSLSSRGLYVPISHAGK